MSLVIFIFFCALFLNGQHHFSIIQHSYCRFYHSIFQKFLPIKINQKIISELILTQSVFIVISSIVLLYTLSLTQFFIFFPLLSLSIILMSIFHIKQKQTVFLQAIDLDFPYFLNLLSNILNSGMDIHQSIHSIQKLLHPSPVKQVLIEYSDLMGSVPSPHQAIQLLAEKFPTQNVCDFGKIVLQSLEQGSSISSSIEKFAKDVQSKHFLHAEKQIQKVPVKMMAPLMLCIFPVTFIIIFVPVILSLL